MEELIKRLERVIQTGAPDKDGLHPIAAEVVLEVVKELTKHGTNLAEVGTDTISRRAAIDIAFKYCPDDDGTCSEAGSDMRNMLDEIEALPPAQPERIIHCKDCEWWTKQECSPQGRCALSGMYPTGGWFCGNARMREVTT